MVETWHKTLLAVFNFICIVELVQHFSIAECACKHVVVGFLVLWQWIWASLVIYQWKNCVFYILQLCHPNLQVHFKVLYPALFCTSVNLIHGVERLLFWVHVHLYSMVLIWGFNCTEVELQWAALGWEDSKETTGEEMRNEGLMRDMNWKREIKWWKEQRATGRPEWAAEGARGRERKSETWPAILLIA